MRDRLCSKVTCRREAVATLSYDYADSMAVIGPLSGEPQPHGYDLCAEHSETLSVPQGWRVIRHSSIVVPGPAASGQQDVV